VHLRGCGEMLPEVSRVAIHRLSGKLAGILALTSVRPGTAHVPQVAVAAEFQRQGVALALMESAFSQLERQGYHEVSLTVTDDNRGALRLYERQGFETFRTFGAFVWDR
jgi:ribosomal protein S18 acetylase RimI-like enzyme